MSVKTKVLLVSTLFSWLMVFLSWRFAHPLEIMVDWTLLALILSVVYLYKKQKSVSRKYLANPELLR